MQKTIDQLIPGDTITSLVLGNGRMHALRQPLRVELPLGPVTAEVWAPEGVKVSGAVTAVEHFVYPEQAEAFEVTETPAKKATRRTIDGITWVKQSTPNAEGGVNWRSEDGRYELGTYVVISWCDDQHPVRLTTEMREGIAADMNKDRMAADRRWGFWTCDAVENGAKGYLCPGGCDHASWAWGSYRIADEEAIVIPNLTTMRDAAQMTAHAVATGQQGI